MKEVYVYQVGDTDCYKIGFTRTSGSERKKNVSTGSPEKLTQVRSVEAEEPTKLETYIHMFLDHKRAPNGEFFYCTIEEVDTAIEKGEKYIKEDLKKMEEGDKFKDQKPNDVLIEPTGEILDIHGELRKAKQEEFFVKQRIQTMEAMLKCIIQGNLGIDGIATWKYVSRVSLDSKLVKDKFPEVFTECSKESGSRRFALERR